MLTPAVGARVLLEPGVYTTGRGEQAAETKRPAVVGFVKGMALFNTIQLNQKHRLKCSDLGRSQIRFIS